MKELVKDIRNGDKDDDKMNYDKFKDSSVYKNAKEDLRKCIDLADKVGEKLGDYEIVRCFENTNYFKEKYVNDNNENVGQKEQQNETNQNQNQSISEEAVQQKELQLTENNSEQQGQKEQQEQQGQQNVTNQNQNQNQTNDERKTQTSESDVGSNDGCDPSYPDICITTYSEKLTCADIPFRNFKVLPPDSHGFDSDSDGVGCEG
jgi:flagellar motor protein MotB